MTSLVYALLVVAAGSLATADYGRHNITMGHRYDDKYGRHNITMEHRYDDKYGRHNITMGHRSTYPPDTLLFYDNPKVNSSWLPRVQSHDVCYPPKGRHPARSIITAFNVTDLIPYGNGGYAFVIEGGVGSTNVCLHLKTQRGKGYNFNITIYGYYI